MHVHPTIQSAYKAFYIVDQINAVSSTSPPPHRPNQLIVLKTEIHLHPSFSHLAVPHHNSSFPPENHQIGSSPHQAQMCRWSSSSATGRRHWHRYMTRDRTWTAETSRWMPPFSQPAWCYSILQFLLMRRTSAFFFFRSCLAFYLDLVWFYF
jgi:hypothetical protein